jgi:hypothetical protein
LLFPKTPRRTKDIKELFEKFKLWVQQERPLENVEFSKNEITLFNEKLYLSFSFQKPIQVILLVKSPQNNIEKMNTVFNKIAGYLNTILNEIIPGGRVSASKEIILKKGDILVKKFVDELAIEKINKKLKKKIEPIAIGARYKNKNRENIMLSFSLEKETSSLIISDHVLKTNIPWDFVFTEEAELAKLEKMIKQIIELEG